MSHYALDICYSTREHRNTQNFKRRLYKGLLTLANAKRDQELQVTQKHPTIPWTRVWTTVNTAWIPERLKSLGYTVIHCIVPTNA